jgi:hypothetical protein
MSRILVDAEQQRRLIPQIEALRLSLPAEHVSAPYAGVLTLPSAAPRRSPEAVAYYERQRDLAQLAARVACQRVGTPDQAEVIINDPCLLASYVPLPGETGWVLPVAHVPYWFRIVMHPQTTCVDLEYAPIARAPQFRLIDPVWASAFTRYVVLAAGGEVAVARETTCMVPEWLALYAHEYAIATCSA